MRDPYDVLGVAKSASALPRSRRIPEAQAKKRHPDANKHRPEGGHALAEINAAYEIVGDEDKRKAFDRGEIDAEGKPRFQGFEGFGQQAGAGAGAGGFRRGGGFESFTWGADGFQRSAGRAGGAQQGGGGFEDILKDVFGARGARSGGGVHSDARTISAPRPAAISRRR